jgi:serine/threonine-protein kinase
MEEMLRDREGQVRRLDWVAPFLEILVKVCDAVAFAHSRGVIHRDLKPGNIMVGAFGQVYVMDWGCAQLVDEGDPAGAPGSDFDDDFGGKTRVFEPPVELDAGHRRVLDGTGTVIGTGAYMAPEQAWGRTDEIDARTDVFALGGCLYQILTRRPPYPGRNHLESVQLAQQAAIAPPADLAPGAPRALCRIAMRALEPDRERRYPSVEALQADVEAFLLGGDYFETRVFAAGTTVMREGEPADAAYIVTSGTCEAFRDEAGERVLLRRMGAGDVFGETALLTGGPRTASVVALDELTTQVVTRESLDDQLRVGSWLATLVKALAERFRDVDEKLAELRRR